MDFVVRCWLKDGRKIVALGYRRDSNFKVLSFDKLVICDVLDITPSQLSDLSEGIYAIDYERR